MKMKSNYSWLLLVVVTLSAFSLVAQNNNSNQQQKQNPVAVTHKTVLNDSPLTSDELNSKDNIQANRNTITEAEMQTERVLYYEFLHFDKLMSIRVLNYIMNNASVKKLALTRSSFAIIVTKDFDSFLLEKNVEKTGLTCKAITKEDYLQTVKEINSK